MFHPGAGQDIGVKQAEDIVSIRGEHPPEAVFLEDGRIEIGASEQDTYKRPLGGEILRFIEPDGVCRAALRNHVVLTLVFEDIRIR